MKKRTSSMAALLLMLFSLSGCGPIGSKTTSMSVIYGVTAALSVLLLLCYCIVVRKRDKWFVLLFSSVSIVNTGYFALSLSKSVETALWANRLSYLGSVFLPMAMLMILLNTTRLQHKKWLPIGLAILSAAVFLIAASPGYLDIYYKTVSITTTGGVTVLQKEYGPWHRLYLVYLVLYFAAMITVIVQKKLVSQGHAAILIVAVGGNIGVWLLEQMVQIDFEFLSVSYIISELFLVSLHLMMQEGENRTFGVNSLHQTTPTPTDKAAPTASEEKDASALSSIEKQCERFSAGLPNLTQTERVIYEFYLAGKSTKEIMAELNIKENTLKYHNKNIYGKLGVSSRKQLMELARILQLVPAQNAETDL